MKVIKKNGQVVDFDINCILDAVAKSADRIGYKLSFQDTNKLIDFIEKNLEPLNENVKTKDLHELVITALSLCGLKDVKNSYQSYRNYKTEFVNAFEEVKRKSEDILYRGDTENANFDSSLVSTKRSLIQGEYTKQLYKQFYLTKEELELTKRGDIYIHDLRDMLLNSFNCCLFDIGNVLKNGFDLSNVSYTEPKSVLTALQVIGDVTLMATGQQFGGFTLAELDRVLVPYCEKTYKYQLNKYLDLGLDEDTAENLAIKELQKELNQGFQSLELKLNTIPSSRGDFAFTTITFGECQNTFAKMASTQMLKVRMKGHKGKHVVFPKLVYLDTGVRDELFDLCIECSSKCMYPDYLSLTGNPSENVVAYEYLHHKTIISPMGCRAYLSPWKDPKTGKYINIGRCNIGAVSLHLPLIYAYAKKNEMSFFEHLEYCLDTIRNFLKKRYEAIAKTKASSNPLCFCQGGLYNGNKGLDEPIGDLVQYMTASFGITALNELTILHNGHTIYEDNSFAKEVVDFIIEKVNCYKKQDGYLYALYGTPAESLCETQAKQYAAYTNDNRFGKYLTNSFHCHVKEKITPFDKQDHEIELFHKINGGHIIYCRIDNPKNLLTIKTVVIRGMKKGLYQGVNFDAVFCEDCGRHSTNVDVKCSYCSSTNLRIISRTCGYLGFSKIHGKSRFNEGKTQEIKDRVSM